MFLSDFPKENGNKKCFQTFLSERRDFYRVYRGPTAGKWSFGLELVFKSFYFGVFRRKTQVFEDFEAQGRSVLCFPGPWRAPNRVLECLVCFLGLGRAVNGPRFRV